MKTTNLNSQYLHLVKNPRDKGQAGILGSQMYPATWTDFDSTIDDAQRTPYSYLLVDLRPETPDEIRIRGAILPDEEKGPTQVYII